MSPQMLNLKAILQRFDAIENGLGNCCHGDDILEVQLFRLRMLPRDEAIRLFREDALRSVFHKHPEVNAIELMKSSYTLFTDNLYVHHAKGAKDHICKTDASFGDIARWLLDGYTDCNTGSMFLFLVFRGKELIVYRN